MFLQFQNKIGYKQMKRIWAARLDLAEKRIFNRWALDPVFFKAPGLTRWKK